MGSKKNKMGCGGVCTLVVWMFVSGWYSVCKLLFFIIYILYFTPHAPHFFWAFGVWFRTWLMGCCYASIVLFLNGLKL